MAQIGVKEISEITDVSINKIRRGIPLSLSKSGKNDPKTVKINIIGKKIGCNM